MKEFMIQPGKIVIFFMKGYPFCIKGVGKILPTNFFTPYPN